MDPKGIWKKLGTTGWRIWQTIWLIFRGRDAGGLVAIHEISALPLLAVRLIHKQKAPLIVVNLGLLHPKNQTGFRRAMWGLLLKNADAVVSLVESQTPELFRVFKIPSAKSHFLPMAVDCGFFNQVNPTHEERFFLAVGTNDGKDFGTLLEALPLGERLVIVTDSFNAKKVRAHRCFGAEIDVREAVSAVALRELYMRARAVIIPLLDTPHGSGHTVLLEAMALGKILVVSNSRSMRGYVEHGHNAIQVPVGDSIAMRRKLHEILEAPERFSALRQGAIRDAHERFSVYKFSEGLKSIVFELAGERGLCMKGSGDGGMEKRKDKRGDYYAFIS